MQGENFEEKESELLRGDNMVCEQDNSTMENGLDDMKMPMC